VRKEKYAQDRDKLRQVLQNLMPREQIMFESAYFNDIYRDFTSRSKTPVANSFGSIPPIEKEEYESTSEDLHTFYDRKQTNINDGQVRSK
jgi:hypothetical protein